MSGKNRKKKCTCHTYYIYYYLLSACDQSNGNNVVFARYTILYALNCGELSKKTINDLPSRKIVVHLSMYFYFLFFRPSNC